MIKTIGIYDSVLDVEDHFKNLQDQVDKLAFLISEFFPEGTTEKDIVSMDNFFNTSDPIMNDKEIISGVLNEESLEAQEDENDDADVLTKPRRYYKDT